MRISADQPSARRDGPRLPVLVPVARRHGLVVDRAVGEHADDVDREHDRVLAVAARVDLDPDPVALRVVIAAGQPPHDRRVQLLAVEAEVDRLVVVEHAHRRALRRAGAVEGGLLGERRRRGRLPSRPRRPRFPSITGAASVLVAARWGAATSVARRTRRGEITTFSARVRQAARHLQARDRPWAHVATEPSAVRDSP